MQVIVELEGVLFDVRAAVWEAYSRAVEAVGLARSDEPTLWRLVRTGAADGQLLKGARPHQLEKFRQTFAHTLDSDEAIAKYVPHDDLHESLRILRELGPSAAVTCGANLTARHALLRANRLADSFPQLTQVAGSSAAGAGALRDLAARRPDERLAVVFAATVELTRTADEAGQVPIGISAGPAIGKRLAAAGARATYGDLPAFATALENQEEPLRRAGLVF